MLLVLGALAFVDLLSEIDEALEVLKQYVDVVSLVVMFNAAAEIFNGLRHFNKLGKFPQVYESHCVYDAQISIIYRLKPFATNVRRIGKHGHGWEEDR